MALVQDENTKDVSDSRNSGIPQIFFFICPSTTKVCLRQLTQFTQPYPLMTQVVHGKKYQFVQYPMTCFYWGGEIVCVCAPRKGLIFRPVAYPNLSKTSRDYWTIWFKHWKPAQAWVDDFIETPLGFGFPWILKCCPCDLKAVGQNAGTLVNIERAHQCAKGPTKVIWSRFWPTASGYDSLTVEFPPPSGVISACGEGRPTSKLGDAKGPNLGQKPFSNSHSGHVRL